jgi:hypothetical protein
MRGLDPGHARALHSFGQYSTLPWQWTLGEQFFFKALLIYIPIVHSKPLRLSSSDSIIAPKPMLLGIVP